jgi:glycopeptide antibiotics resistance protein
MLRKLFYLSLATVYVAVVATVTLTSGPGPERGSWVPFGQIWPMLTNGVRLYSTGQVLGNIALFVPFGWLLPMMWRRFRSYATIGSLAAASSAIIELIQLWFLSGRSPATDDVILNTFGAVVGAFMFFAPRDDLRAEPPAPARSPERSSTTVGA